MFVRYIGGKEGGLDKLKGKTIGYIYLRRPLRPGADPAARALAKDYGFDAEEISGAGGRDAEPVVALAQRSPRSPDWMIMWGWGAMNPTAVKEAAKNSYPMDHFIGVWWSGGEDDARPAGAAAKGYLSLNFNAVGANFPAIKDIQKYVIDKGKSQTPKDKVGENFYNRGVIIR